MRKKTVLAMNLLILFTVVLLTLLCIEAGVRVYYYGIKNTLTGRVSTVVPISMTGLLKLSDNDKVVYELKPNAEGLSKFVSVKTNQEGFRDKSYHLEKAKDAYRIVVLGDSIAFGIGVSQEEIFSKRLEKALQGLCNKNNVEVLNFAVPAYNTSQEMEVLKTKALKYKPDLVILAYYLNDIFPPVDISRDLEFSIKGLFYKRSHLFRFIYERIRQSEGKMSYTQELEYNYRDDSKQWIEQKVNFEELKRMSEANRFITLFVLLPSMTDFDGMYPFKKIDSKVLNEAKRNDFLILDLLPFFKGRNPANLWILKTDKHPNSKAHKIIADALYDYLKRENAICMGKAY